IQVIESSPPPFITVYRCSLPCNVIQVTINSAYRRHPFRLLPQSIISCRFPGAQSPRMLVSSPLNITVPPPASIPLNDTINNADELDIPVFSNRPSSLDLEIGLPLTRASTFPEMSLHDHHNFMGISSDEDSDHAENTTLGSHTPSAHWQNGGGTSIREFRSGSVPRLVNFARNAGGGIIAPARRAINRPPVPTTRRSIGGIGIREVERLADGQLIDTYAKTVLFKVQDWKVEYKSDKREDVLIIRVRCKDDESYRRLMKLLADFS
ncbi:hypothetical protein BDR26DRAFT_540332, partial [Obelidium mucronatum]